MSETRVLLAKISALRQRLEQAQGLVNEARSAASALLIGQAEDSAGSLPLAVAGASEHDLALDAAVRPVTGELVNRSPRQLTSRARRVLERGRDLLGQLRELAEAFPDSDSGVSVSSPLGYLYRDTVSMIDTALRTVALLPDSTTSQCICVGGWR
jgi:hypothetical protein